MHHSTVRVQGPAYRSRRYVSYLPRGALNLAASSAVHAGLPIATDELRIDVLVAEMLPVFTS